MEPMPLLDPTRETRAEAVQEVIVLPDVTASEVEVLLPVDVSEISDADQKRAEMEAKWQEIQAGRIALGLPILDNHAYGDWRRFRNTRGQK